MLAGHSEATPGRRRILLLPPEVAMRSRVTWVVLGLAAVGAVVACSADTGEDVFGKPVTGKGGSAGSKTDGGGRRGRRRGLVGRWVAPGA